MTPHVELLTAQERDLVRLLGDCYTKFGAVCGHGRTREDDLNEFASRIHALQHTVMAQAAARAYPDLFRLLGGGKS